MLTLQGKALGIAGAVNAFMVLQDQAEGVHRNLRVFLKEPEAQGRVPVQNFPLLGVKRLCFINNFFFEMGSGPDRVITPPVLLLGSPVQVSPRNP